MNRIKKTGKGYGVLPLPSRGNPPGIKWYPSDLEAVMNNNIHYLVNVETEAIEFYRENWITTPYITTIYKDLKTAKYMVTCTNLVTLQGISLSLNKLIKNNIILPATSIPLDIEEECHKVLLHYVILYSPVKYVKFFKLSPEDNKIINEITSLYRPFQFTEIVNKSYTSPVTHMITNRDNMFTITKHGETRWISFVTSDPFIKIPELETFSISIYGLRESTGLLDAVINTNNVNVQVNIGDIVREHDFASVKIVNNIDHSKEFEKTGELQKDRLYTGIVFKALLVYWKDQPRVISDMCESTTEALINLKHKLGIKGPLNTPLIT